MGVINVQQQNADEQQKSVAIKSKKTGEEEIVCKKLAEAAMKDLAGAMPALEDAVAVSGIKINYSNYPFQESTLY